jgi:hypothetical protein
MRLADTSNEMWDTTFHEMDLFIRPPRIKTLHSHDPLVPTRANQEREAAL